MSLSLCPLVPPEAKSKGDHLMQPPSPGACARCHSAASLLGPLGGESQSLIPEFSHSFQSMQGQPRIRQSAPPVLRRLGSLCGPCRRSHLLLAVKLGARGMVHSLLRGTTGALRVPGSPESGGEAKALGWSSCW